jgi:hypothetical protein
MSEPVVVEVRSDTSQAHREVQKFFGGLKGQIQPTIDVVNALGVAWNAAATAIRFATEQVVAGVRQALEAESASRRLATAVGLHGDRARALVPQLEAYNDKLEKQTLISAESISGIQAQAAALGVLPEHLREVTRATLGWSEMMGKDLGAALQDVLGVMGGKLPEAITKLRPEIKQAGEALEFMAGGMTLAADKSRTTEGRLELLRIRFDDVREAIGKAIIESRAFGAALDALASEESFKDWVGRTIFGESREERTRSFIQRPWDPGLSERPQELELTRGTSAADVANAAQRARGPAARSTGAGREMDAAVQQFREMRRQEEELDLAAVTDYQQKRQELDHAQIAHLAEMQDRRDEDHERSLARLQAQREMHEMEVMSLQDYGAAVTGSLEQIATNTLGMAEMITGSLTSMVQGLGAALGGGLAAALETLVIGGKDLASSLADIAASIFTTLGAQLLSMAGVLGILGIFNPALLPIAGAMGAAGAAATVAGALIKRAASGDGGSTPTVPSVRGGGGGGFTSFAPPQSTSVAQSAPGGVNISVVIGHGAVITDSRRQLGRVIQEILDDYAALSPRRA